MHRQDILWKGLLEDVFADFLELLYPDVWSVLDKQRGFTFLEQELEQVFPPGDDQFSPKVVDKLVRAYTLEGREEWILIHIEVQHQYRRNFSERMFVYFFRLFDKYRKKITAFAVFTEVSPKERPDSYETSFMGTSLQYRFNTYKIAAQDEEVLAASDNLFALLVLVAKRSLWVSRIADPKERDRHLYEIKIELAKLLLFRNIAKEKIGVLLNFLRYYVLFENPEIKVKFEEEIDVLTERNTAMGLEELLLDLAEKRGALKEREKAATQMLEEKRKIARAMKADGLPITQISKFTGLSSKELEKL